MSQIARRSRIRKPAIMVGSIILALSSSAANAGNLDVDFDPTNFDYPTTINNQYWPLSSLPDLVYYAEGEDGCEVSKTHILPTLKSDFAGDYAGISAVQVEDLAWLSEECDGDYVLVEETVDWYAQDNDGNVWYLGEDTTAYDDDEECPTSAGSWEAGSDIAGVGSDAEAGIVMLANPVVGLAYQQEYYEDEAEDMARILQTDAPVDIEFGSYEECLKTKEWTALESGHVEHKFYCPSSGLGLMLVNELKGKTLRVELVGYSLNDVPLPEGGGSNTFPSPPGTCPP